jgi:ABC-type uncharacterized transport system auxiliary subunit
MKRSALAVLLAGCSILSKSKPVEIRYYAPELMPVQTASSESRVERAACGAMPIAMRARLRLGRIRGSAHLRERIAFRESPVKIGLYYARRWTEDPEIYIERATRRVLFESGTMEQAIGGTERTLDIDVLAFEEIRGAPSRARIELAYRLHDDRTIYASGSFTVERIARANDFDAFVTTMGATIDATAEHLGDVVAAAISCP